MIVRFKFGGEFWLGRDILKRAQQSGWLPELGDGVDGVVPGPLHPRRERERGYNQALLLASALCKLTGWPLRARVLRRTRYTSQQTRLSANQRRDNVRGAFAPAGENLEGQHLLLVDDVMTTGATVSECAKVLKKSGASRVSVLTLARARP